MIGQGGTWGDVVGRDETSTQCVVCVQLMNGADDLWRCRVNGLPASAANADGCKKFADVALDYMLADQVRPWCK